MKNLLPCILRKLIREHIIFQHETLRRNIYYLESNTNFTTYIESPKEYTLKRFVTFRADIDILNKKSLFKFLCNCDNHQDFIFFFIYFI